MNIPGGRTWGELKNGLGFQLGDRVALTAEPGVSYQVCRYPVVDAQGNSRYDLSDTSSYYLNSKVGVDGAKVRHVVEVLDVVQLQQIPDGSTPSAQQRRMQVCLYRVCVFSRLVILV